MERRSIQANTPADTVLESNEEVRPNVCKVEGDSLSEGNPVGELGNFIEGLVGVRRGSISTLFFYTCTWKIRAIQIKWQSLVN